MCVWYGAPQWKKSSSKTCAPTAATNITGPPSEAHVTMPPTTATMKIPPYLTPAGDSATSSATATTTSTTSATMYEEFENDINNIHEGYMFLKNRCLFRQWMLKPKYFILTPHYLYCFKRRGDLTSIPRDVIPLQYLAVSIDEDTKGLRKHYYVKLDSPVTKKTFNMFCFSVEERDQWLAMILQVLAKNFLHAEYSNRYLKSSYSSRSLSRLTGYNVRQSVELNKMSSLSCMELTNFGFNEEQKAMQRLHRRKTISDIELDGDHNDITITSDSTSGFRKAASFSSYHISSLDATGNLITSEKVTYRRKKVKRHHSTSSSILGRLSYINTMNIRNSTIGSTIRTSLIEKLKKT